MEKTLEIQYVDGSFHRWNYTADGDPVQIRIDAMEAFYSEFGNAVSIVGTKWAETPTTR